MVTFNNDGLEWIITMQAGIGMTLPEAEMAMVESKKQKPALDWSGSIESAIHGMMDDVFAKKFPIVTYNSGISVDDNLIFTKDLVAQVESDYAEYLKYDMRPEVQESLLKIMHSKRYDKKTGLLTLYGHLLEKKLNNDAEQGVVVYIDCGFMHELNRIFYDTEVDRRLDIMGKAFSSCVRRSNVSPGPDKNSRREDVSGRDFLMRLNGDSADGYFSRRRGENGDEFVAEIFAPIESLPGIVNRFFIAAYTAQYREFCGKELYPVGK